MGPEHELHPDHVQQVRGLVQVHLLHALIIHHVQLNGGVLDTCAGQHGGLGSQGDGEGWGNATCGPDSVVKFVPKPPFCALTVSAHT